MRLVNYRSDSGERCGVHVNDVIVDVQNALKQTGLEVDHRIRQFISREDWNDLARLAAGTDLDATTTVRFDDVELGAVIPDPQKIVFVGGNTNSHLLEAAKLTNAAAPLRPMLTSKTTNAINGPYDPIVQPAGTHTMDYEAELCVVIGARARRVAEEDVANIIAGYTVANDVSDREYQLSTWEDNSFYRTHFLGKSFDGFCPCGPELVTPDEIADLKSLQVTCHVNGEIKQDGPLSDLYFSVEQVLSHLSMGITLEPGDLILMGSPAGVAHFAKPPTYVGPGDVVRCAVESLGYVENHIVADS